MLKAAHPLPLHITLVKIPGLHADGVNVQVGDEDIARFPTLRLVSRVRRRTTVMKFVTATVGEGKDLVLTAHAREFG